MQRQFDISLILFQQELKNKTRLQTIKNENYYFYAKRNFIFRAYLIIKDLLLEIENFTFEIYYLNNNIKENKDRIKKYNDLKTREF